MNTEFKLSHETCILHKTNIYLFEMKKFVFIVLFSMCSTLFAEIWSPSSPTYSDYLNSWCGISADKLLTSWGVANREDSLLDGGRVLDYHKDVTETTFGRYVQGSVTTSSYKDSKGNIHYTQNITEGYYIPPETHHYSAYVLFTVNKNNIITNFNYEGQLRALMEFITEARCPYFNPDKFYLPQYSKKAQEWIGYTLEDLKNVYSEKSKIFFVQNKTNIDDTIISDRQTFIVKHIDNPDSKIIFTFDKQKEKIETVEVTGSYEELEDIYSSPLNIRIKELNFCFIPGLSIGDSIGINCGINMDLIHGIKFLSDFDVFIDEDVFNVVLLPLAFEYYFVDKEKIKCYVGSGIDVGYNFGSDGNGPNFGWRYFTGAQFFNFDIKFAVRPSFYNWGNTFHGDWKFQFSYALNLEMLGVK